MILSSGWNVGKVKTAVFSEATKKRRPRTSWMVKPSPESEKAIPLITTPGAPTFGETPEAAAAHASAERTAEPAKSAFPPANAEVDKAAHVVVERGPSPLEIARVRALEQRERQLEQSIEDVAELRRSILAETEQQLVELAAAIARRVIGRELALDPEILLSLAA